MTAAILSGRCAEDDPQAEFNFQQDEEVQASRILNLATRQCVEIGLHRRHTLLEAFPNPEDRSWALKLFWSIYMLDRRWSFGTGMPFALQDADIDPQLPEPVSISMALYTLEALINQGQCFAILNGNDSL